MPAFKITNQPKTSENKTQTQNSAHEGIKFHQPRSIFRYGNEFLNEIGSPKKCDKIGLFFK